MSLVKRLFLFCLTFALLSCALPAACLAQDEPLTAVSAPDTVSAKAAILIEAESGEVIYRKNDGICLPMASTTKIMTALVALDRAAPETVIAVDARAVGVEGSSVYLTEGEKLTLEQLLYALLLESANDAAVAIAVGICGSVEAFAGKMNEKAAELGLRNSHFVNPHGLDDECHYTTAYDLALITKAAMEYDLFRTIVSTRKSTIPHEGTGGVRLLINHNKLLRMFDGCVGVKTGFTKKSGRCLVTAAERGGVTVIAVTLDAPDDWNDHIRMLEYGLSLYDRVTLLEENGFSLDLPVVGGSAPTVTVTNQTGCALTLPARHGEIRQTVELPEFLYAGVTSGDRVGRILYFADVDGNGSEETVAEIPLISSASSEKPERESGFFGWIQSLWSKILGLFRKQNSQD